MPTALSVSKSAVRQFLLDRQLLQPARESSASNVEVVLQTVRHLECVQLDPVAAVERNQHLALSARLRRYQPNMLERLLEQGRVFEYWANAMCVIPMEDYPVFEVVRRRRSQHIEAQLENLGNIVGDVLKRLERDGPLPSKAFESAEKVHGYWDNTPKTKATSHAINLLNDLGRIQVVRREGTTRYFDIRERAVPPKLLEQAAIISDEEAKSAMVDKYLRAYRVFDAGDSRFGWANMKVDERKAQIERRVTQGEVVPLEIEGVKRAYYILSEDVETLEGYMSNESASASGYVRFLPPLDNLLWRRQRLEDLFDFTYTWEVYIPAAKRQYGYYTMPILVGDRLIGRIDPRLDRSQGRLNLELLQIDPQVRWTKALSQRVFRALDKFAKFHHATLGDVTRTFPEGMHLSL